GLPRAKACATTATNLARSTSTSSSQRRNRRGTGRVSNAHCAMRLQLAVEVMAPILLPARSVVGGLEQYNARRRNVMTDQATPPKLELSHTALSEDEALRILDGHRIRRGSRVMDPKAQIVGEFVKSVRVPGYFPPLPELRQQLRTMVTLMDEPAPALPRIEDIRIRGAAGEIPARVYAPHTTRALS